MALAARLSALSMAWGASYLAQTSCRPIGCDHEAVYFHNVLKSAVFSEGSPPPPLACTLLPPSGTAATDLVIRGRAGDVVFVHVVDGTAAVRINDCSSEAPRTPIRVGALQPRCPAVVEFRASTLVR